VAGRLSIGVRERVLEFLARHGEKGYAVLRAAVEATLSSSGSRGVRLGDFSYKEVVAKLRTYGLDYNPANLLAQLEKSYAIIETTYKSSGQHWWRFIDIDAVIEALEEYERGRVVNESVMVEEGEWGGQEPTIDDPQVEVIRAQIAALDLDNLVRMLRMLSSKPRLTPQDRKLFARIAFNELELVATVLEKARSYPDVFEEEIKMLENVLRLASLVARKLMAGRSVGVREATSRTSVRSIVNHGAMT